MRYIAAYLLLQIGGNSNPSAKDIKKVLSSVGIEADSTRLNKLLSELEGKSIDQVNASSLCVVAPNSNFLVQLIAEGSAKLSSVPSGGGGGGGAAPSGGAAPAAAAAEVVEEKKEEAKVSSRKLLPNSH